MSPILTLCGGFLLAVLWMDLMFDVQVLRSIAAYYSRVTTQARPMNHAIGGTMLVAILTLLAEITRGDAHRTVGLISLVLCGGPIILAALRVVPNAVRLGARVDPPAEQSRLARVIC